MERQESGSRGPCKMGRNIATSEALAMTAWKPINQILMAKHKSKLTCQTALKILYLWLIHVVLYETNTAL